jgi:outer membrane protein OmpA-like peptidoglycan-associated protein
MTQRPRRPKPPHLTAFSALVLSTLFVSSCSTPKPPTPPSVSPSQKRPVNDPKEVELHLLRTRLRNANLELDLREQQAQLQALSVPVDLRAAVAVQDDSLPASKPNKIFVITFGIGESSIQLSADDTLRLLADAKTAAHVAVRGRTDGTQDIAVEARVARNRAAAMRAFLVGGGVDPDRVRVMYQPSGDRLAENESPAGRALNRRVEVELYANKPQLQVLGPGKRSQS